MRASVLGAAARPAQVGGVAAQPRVVEVLRVEPVCRGPAGELPDVGAVGARACARPRRGGAGRGRTAQRRLAPSARPGTSLGARWPRSSSTRPPVRSPRCGSSWRRARPTRRAAAAPLVPDPGHAGRLHHVVRRAAPAGAGRVHRHPRPSAHRHHASLLQRGWQEVPVAEIGVPGAVRPGSGDVDRGPEPGHLVVELDHVGDPHADAAVRGGACRSSRPRPCRGCRRRRRCPASAP